MFPIISFLLFFHFSFSFFIFFSSSFFSFCELFEQTPKPAKNRPEVPIVKKTISSCENSIFGPRWTGGRGGRGEGVRNGTLACDFSFMFFIIVVVVSEAR